jgi:hypothetical protein
MVVYRLEGDIERRKHKREIRSGMLNQINEKREAGRWIFVIDKEL